MGANGGVLEKVTGGFLKNHRWKFLKPQVAFLKTTGGFIQASLETYQREAGNGPSLLRGWTNLKGREEGFARVARQIFCGLCLKVPRKYGIIYGVRED